MKRLLTFVLLAAATSPALAQHEGHEQAPPAAPVEAQDAHAGHSEAEPADPHAGHDQTAPATDDPHAGHDMPEDPHAGHQDREADPHAGHAMEGQPPAPPVAPPPSEALSGPEHAADLIFGAEQMAGAREDLRRIHGDVRAYRFLVDRLEMSLRNGHDGYEWEDVQFWYGDDIDRLWIKSQGEGEFGGRLERFEVQALWSRALDPWFDLQTGIRYDFRPDPERAYFVLGVQGLAPYWFEIDAALFVSHKGDVSARIEGEYDQRITQRLILQPRAEVELAAQDVPELGIGSGLSSAEAGLRLRYEIVPEFAPYVGVQYERRFGDTRRFAREADEDTGGWSLVMGVRAWF